MNEFIHENPSNEGTQHKNVYGWPNGQSFPAPPPKEYDPSWRVECSQDEEHNWAFVVVTGPVDEMEGVSPLAFIYEYRGRPLLDPCVFWPKDREVPKILVRGAYDREWRLLAEWLPEQVKICK